MPSHMSPWEKLQYYVRRIHLFEEKNNFAIGKYTFSEYLFLIIVGLLFAFFLPQIIPITTIWNIVLILIVLYVLYLLTCFFMAGGRGRVVDVLNI